MQLTGLLFFPITPFVDNGVDAELLATHISERLAFDPGAIFVACGTGEFHAMSLAEHATAVRTAVEVAGGSTPVIAGAGGPLPYAVGCARQAAEAGADGLLVMPPYLVTGPTHGIVDYVHAIADGSGLPVIAYHRDNARFTPGAAQRLAEHPLVVGLKDGVGDLDLLQRIVVAVRRAEHPEWMFFNGLPTAELTMRSYHGMGVELYSSAVFAFLPEVAQAFRRTLGDTSAEGRRLGDRLLDEFYAPLVALRNEVPGYAVSLVKAGVRLRGFDVGGVRLPLVDPTAEHVAELGRLIETGLKIVDG